MSDMTRAEAIYCLQSYQPDAPDDMCQKCPYYRSVKVDDNVYTCKSDVARAIAINSLQIDEQYDLMYEQANKCADCTHIDDIDNEVCLECEYDGKTRGNTRFEQAEPCECCDTCEHLAEVDGSNCYECVKGMKDNYNAQEPTGWIPVSERVPEDIGYVWLTCISKVDDREPWVCEGFYNPYYTGDNYSKWGNIPMLNWGEAEVVAWMKKDIPEPYKAEKEIENE